MVRKEFDRDAAAAAKLEAWMADAEAIEEAWGDVTEGLDLGFNAAQVSVALTATDSNDRMAYALEILDDIEKKVREQLQKGVADAVTADLKQAGYDEGEMRAWDKEDNNGL